LVVQQPDAVAPRFTPAAPSLTFSAIFASLNSLIRP
jgi:hypothetical protein